MVANAFFERVNRHRMEGRDLGAGEAVENVILEFRPRPTPDMLVACLWSRWTAPGEPELLSFAAITDGAAGPTVISDPGEDVTGHGWAKLGPQMGHKAKRRPQGRRSTIPKLLLLFENFGCEGRI